MAQVSGQSCGHPPKKRRALRLLVHVLWLLPGDAREPLGSMRESLRSKHALSTGHCPEGLTPNRQFRGASRQGRAPHLRAVPCRHSANPRRAIDPSARVPSSGHPCAFGFARRSAHAADDAAVARSATSRHSRASSRAARARPLPTARAVHMNDELKTGADGHLQVTFRDDTVLTLQRGRARRDRPLRVRPRPGRGRCSADDDARRVPLRDRKDEELTEKEITVATPVAEIGVRGTEFWGGPVDGEYSVLLLPARST